MTLHVLLFGIELYKLQIMRNLTNHDFDYDICQLTSTDSSISSFQFVMLQKSENAEDIG